MLGVELTNGVTATTIAGNYVGTDVTGLLGIPNGAGVNIGGGSTSNTIGGTVAGSLNVISANVHKAVLITDAGTDDNLVEGNLHRHRRHRHPRPGQRRRRGGPRHRAQINTIGGTTAAARNVIAASTGNGVIIGGTGTNGATTSHNLVEGNYIGTDMTGTAALGEGIAGVNIESGATNNTIGGTTAAARNVISGNSFGVYIGGIGASDNLVEGNYIGTDVTGTHALGNGSSGVSIVGGASGNTIGGTTAAARNVISGNVGNGVVIDGSGTTGNLVEGNYIGTDAPAPTPSATAMPPTAQWGADHRRGVGQHDRRDDGRGRQRHLGQHRQRRGHRRPGHRSTTWWRATSSAPTPPAPHALGNSGLRDRDRQRGVGQHHRRDDGRRAQRHLGQRRARAWPSPARARRATSSKGTTSAPTPPAPTPSATATAAWSSDYPTGPQATPSAGRRPGPRDVISGNAAAGVYHRRRGARRATWSRATTSAPTSTGTGPWQQQRWAWISWKGRRPTPSAGRRPAPQRHLGQRRRRRGHQRRGHDGQRRRGRLHRHRRHRHRRPGQRGDGQWSIFGGASDNTIGGTSAGRRRRHLGQRHLTAWSSSTRAPNDNVVEGDYIGTDATGTARPGQQRRRGGLVNRGVEQHHRRDDGRRANVISGNAGPGVVHRRLGHDRQRGGGRLHRHRRRPAPGPGQRRAAGSSSSTGPRTTPSAGRPPGPATSSRATRRLA